MYNVVWEFPDGTQYESEVWFGEVEDAANYLKEKVDELGGEFSWIQIEKVENEDASE